MIAACILLSGLSVLTCGSQGLRPPVVEWRISRSVVAGEPIFLEYVVNNPNSSKITVNFRPSRISWFSTSLDSSSPTTLGMKLQPRLLDEVRGLTTQLIEGHSLCRRVIALNLPEYAKSAGKYTVTIRGSLLYRPGTSYEEAPLSDDQTLATTQQLPLIVREGSDEALEVAAGRIGRAIVDPNAGPAEGIDGSACPDLTKIWLSMPVGPSMSAWQRYLFSGKCDGKLPSAVACLCVRKEPEAQKLVQDIVRYVHDHQPSMDRTIQEAIRNAKSAKAM